MYAQAESRGPIREFALRVGRGSAASDATIVTPAGPWRSAAVVVGEEPDLDGNAQKVAHALADEGHGVIALGHRAVTADVLETEIAGRIEGALAELCRRAPRQPDRLAVVGYGAGGFAPFVALGRSRFSAAVSFYGDGPARAGAALDHVVDLPKRHAPTLLCLIGAEDRTVDAAVLGAIDERLTRFGMRHSIVVYPRTRRAFCLPGPEYRAKEAADAWRRLLDALETGPKIRTRFRKTK